MFVHAAQRMERKMAKRRLDGLVWLVLAILVIAVPVAACSGDNTTGGNDSGATSGG
jgi:hypothetical protein